MNHSIFSIPLFGILLASVLPEKVSAIEESDFAFGDNVGEIQFNQDPLVSILNQASRSGSSSSDTSSNQFTGEFMVEFLPNEEEATSIQITHKGLIENTGSTASSTELEDNFTYILNKVFFEAFDPNEGISEDELVFMLDFDVHANDPSGNTNNTFVAAGAEIDLFGESLTPIWSSNGFFSLDSNTPPGTPQFNGSFTGNGGAVDNGGGDFTTSVMFSENSPNLPFGQPFGVDVETFLQITNVETFGGVDFTALDSTNTFVLTIAGSNAATRFRRFQKDVAVQPDGLIQRKGQNVISRRPIQRQTFKTTVTRKKRITWRVENNGPDVNLEEGPRSIICKGPRNSSRQKFRYFNKSEGRRNITSAIVRGRFVLPPHTAGQGDNLEVEVKSKRKRFGKKRQNSFNMTARTPTGAKDVVRLQVISR